MTTTLLAVDDSKTMRRVLEITFAGEGDYRAVVAGSAEEAYSKVRVERPRVVLVDAALQGTSGYDVCQRIKADVPGTSVILLSSKQSPYDRGRGMSAGVDDFIDKPFDTQQLIDKVGGVLKQAGAAPPAPQRPAAPPVQPRPAAPVMTTGRPAASSMQTPASTSFSAEPRARVQTLAYGATPSGSAPRPAAAVSVGAPSSAGARSASPTQGGIGTAAPSAPASARPVVRTAQPGAAGISRPISPVVSERPSTPGRADAPGSSPAVNRAAASADFEARLQGLGLTSEQVQGVLSLSREVVEQAVWEVVPVLAETMIREEIERLTRE